MADRDYIFLEMTRSLCPACLRTVEAKVIIQEGRVHLDKRCPEHGQQRVLISTDAEYYRLCRQTLKAGQLPKRFNTKIEKGCPHDCGICPDHEQHACVALVEITDACNMACPVCYSCSSPEGKKTLTLPGRGQSPIPLPSPGVPGEGKENAGGLNGVPGEGKYGQGGQHRSMAEIEAMLDAVVANQGEPDVVQISGGEPTIHPEFFQVLDSAKRRPIKHLMVNTNGVRIANDEMFTRRLKHYMPGLDVYLQFDSLTPKVLEELRGGDLSDVRKRALERLNRHGISTTLVATLKKGLNDGEVGQVIDYALKQPCVRGVTFQPIQVAGRLEHFDPEKDRLTLAEVRQRILDQCRLFTPADIMPVPCNPDCLAMAYAVKFGGMVMPLGSLVDPKVLLTAEGSSIAYEKNPAVREQVIKALTTGTATKSAGGFLAKLCGCCGVTPRLPEQIGYENIFRVIIVQFLDAWDFDVRAVKKSCVQIAQADGRMIPFDTHNIFHRRSS